MYNQKCLCFSYLLQIVVDFMVCGFPLLFQWLIFLIFTSLNKESNVKKLSKNKWKRSNDNVFKTSAYFKRIVDLKPN